MKFKWGGMMVELKTLNEIDQEFSFTDKEVNELGLKFSDMDKIGFAQDERDKTIRKEAIKWIKKIENKDSLMHSWKEMGCLPWIVHFFNITDEELKEANK